MKHPLEHRGRPARMKVWPSPKKYRRTSLVPLCNGYQPRPLYVGRRTLPNGGQVLNVSRYRPRPIFHLGCNCCDGTQNENAQTIASFGVNSRQRDGGRGEGSRLRRQGIFSPPKQCIEGTCSNVPAKPSPNPGYLLLNTRNFYRLRRYSRLRGRNRTQTGRRCYGQTIQMVQALPVDL